MPAPNGGSEYDVVLQSDLDRSGCSLRASGRGRIAFQLRADRRAAGFARTVRILLGSCRCRSSVDTAMKPRKPMFLKLKRPALCHLCGARIPAGAVARWYRSGAVFGLACHDQTPQPIDGRSLAAGEVSC